MKLMWLFIQLFAVGWLLLFDGKIHECCICFPPCVIRSNPIYFKELPHNPRTCQLASLLVLPFAHPAFPLYLDYIHTTIYKEGGGCTKAQKEWRRYDHSQALFLYLCIKLALSALEMMSGRNVYEDTECCSETRTAFDDDKKLCQNVYLYKYLYLLADVSRPITMQLLAVLSMTGYKVKIFYTTRRDEPKHVCCISFL